jgi:hypothetical protein
MCLLDSLDRNDQKESSMSQLRSQLIRLAYRKPELRPYLLPLLRSKQAWGPAWGSKGLALSEGLDHSRLVKQLSQNVAAFLKICFIKSMLGDSNVSLWMSTIRRELNSAIDEKKLAPAVERIIAEIKDIGLME